MLSLRLITNDDYEYLAGRQTELEQHARQLVAAWSDFDIVERSANEVIRCFGNIEPRDLGVMRLHKEPNFLALQMACVVGYVRPFAAGLARLDAMYAIYIKPEWQDFHEDLFVWKEKLTGDRNMASRRYVIAPNIDRNADGERFVAGEATQVLAPLRDFTRLGQMCADRKAKIWPKLQEALNDCYPVLRHPVLLDVEVPSRR